VPNLEDRRYVAFVLYTGMRRNEAAKLTWKEYDATEGVFTCRPSGQRTARACGCT
jgi:integrase